MNAMNNTLPIPDELWDKIPTDAQAADAAAFLSVRN